MSSQHNRVLATLAFHVAEHGTFPQRERFRASQATLVPAFDELVQWRELFAWDNRTLIVWTIKALARIELDVDFARQELARARVVFDELVRMYHETLGRNHNVADLASRVGFTHDDQVRRALMLLQPVGIFDDFAIWLGNIDERFQISESILTQTADLFPKHVASGQGPSWEQAMHQVVDFQDDLGSLANALFRLLRQGRAHVRAPTTAPPPDSEIQSLGAVLKTGASELAIRRAVVICEGLPGLETAVAILEQSLPPGRL